MDLKKKSQGLSQAKRGLKENFPGLPKAKRGFKKNIKTSTHKTWI